MGPRGWCCVYMETGRVVGRLWESKLGPWEVFCTYGKLRMEEIGDIMLLIQG